MANNIQDRLKIAINTHKETERAERRGKNPGTGEEMSIPPERW